MSDARAESLRSELRALLTVAADVEASRQRAVRDGDLARAAALDAELRKIWRRHSELEDRVA